MTHMTVVPRSARRATAPLALVGLLAVLAGLGLAPAASASPTEVKLDPNYRVTSAVPTVQQLDDMVEFLVETNASDEAKAANLEGGSRAVIVPRTVYNLGIFRAPRGGNSVTEPLNLNGNEATALLHAYSAGRPPIEMTVTWKRIDGAWKMANKSLCAGVRTVGLNIPCAFD